MPHSNWTESANSISLVPVTTNINTGSAPENVNYLTNADKIALMAQYSAMLATKTTLDETASSLGISSSFYDNACANISTTLIAAGAPSNWATIWPDGTTSGPWPNIQGDLANLWAQIASQQTALQTAISSAQAAAAEAAAVAAAAITAEAQTQAALATLAKAPVVVSALPTLPDASFPVGIMVWLTSNSQLYTNVGNTWFTLAVPATGIAGLLTASQIASLTAAQLTGQITSTQISDGAVSTPQLAAGSITSAQIAAGAVVAGAIAAGAVTAGTLAAGAVTAGTLAANAVTAGTIAAGAIGADEIAAHSITTEQLVITSSGMALNSDPYCTDASAWAVGDGGTYIVGPVTDGLIGTSVIQLANANVRSLAIPITPGQTYRLTVTARGVAAAATGNYLRFYQFPASVALGDSGWPASGLITSTIGEENITLGSSWQTTNVVVTAAAAAAYGCLSFHASWAEGGGNGVTVQLQDFELDAQVGAELIVDGTITSAKIATGAITADMITTGTLNAALVTVTNLNASNITTGTLAATQVVFPDGTAVSTASRVATYPAQASSAPEITTNGPVAIAGLAWTVTSSGPSDVFNVLGAIQSTEDTSVSEALGAVVMLVVDGDTGSPAGARSLPQSGWTPAMFSITSLAAGTHTFALYANNAAGYSIASDSYALLQRVV